MPLKYHELKAGLGQFVVVIGRLLVVSEKVPVCSKVLAKTDGDISIRVAAKDCCEKRITDAHRHIPISINLLMVNPPLSKLFQ
jgi:hypothetical protein